MKKGVPTALRKARAAEERKAKREAKRAARKGNAALPTTDERQDRRSD